MVYGTMVRCESMGGSRLINLTVRTGRNDPSAAEASRSNGAQACPPFCIVDMWPSAPPQSECY